MGESMSAHLCRECKSESKVAVGNECVIPPRHGIDFAIPCVGGIVEQRYAVEASIIFMPEQSTTLPLASV